VNECVKRGKIQRLCGSCGFLWEKLHSDSSRP
jgi:hypothetical protein